MSIVRADNFTDFNLPSDLTPTQSVRPILNTLNTFPAALITADTANYAQMALRVPDGAFSDPEGRRWLHLRTLTTSGAGYGQAISMNQPIVPAVIGNTIYTSFRVIPMFWPAYAGTTGTPSYGQDFIFGLVTGTTLPVNASPGFQLIRQNGHTIQVVTSSAVTVPEDIVNLTSSTRVPVQFDLKITRNATATCLVSVWCNNVPVIADIQTSISTGYLYPWIGSLKTSNGVTHPVPCDVFFKDIIIIEVDGVGLQYRAGPGARVQNVVPSSDVISEWAQPGGYIGSHAALMARQYNYPLQTDGLLADTLGLRESYNFSDLNPNLGSIVPAVIVEMLQSNGGSVVRPIEFMQNDTVISTLNSNPGAPSILQTKMHVNPATGQPWTVAEVNALVMGYRLKSS